MSNCQHWWAALIFLALVGLACQTTSIFDDSSPRDILFQDDFSDYSSGWLQGEDRFGIAEYAHGGFRIYVATEQSSRLSLLSLQSFRDVQIEVYATKIAGPDDNDYGVVCRYVDENNFYFFQISSDGYYGIGKYKKNELILINASQMQPSDVIIQGAATNHLRADCVGDRLALYVNGFKVGEVRDADFSSGYVGLIAGTFETPGTDILFDNFMVLTPEQD